MRITIPVAVSGDCWMPIFPSVDAKAAYPKDAQGREVFDEAAFRRAVRNNERIMFAPDDRGPVCGFAAMLLDAAGRWLDDNDKSDGSKEMKRVETSCRTRLKRDRAARVRIDLSNAYVEHKGRRVCTVRVKITHDARNAVGEPFERDCAMFLADMCAGFSRRFEERGDAPLVFTPETQALLVATKGRTLVSQTARSNEWRTLCSHHRRGYCAPICPDCTHYHNGRCEVVRHVFDDGDVAASVPLSAEAERIEKIVKGE